jgi:Zn-dependent protease with chaperone function/SAM-dependent methyltransferase
MKSRVGDRVERAVGLFPIKLTVLFLIGVVVTAVLLNETILHVAASVRVSVAIVFLTFATGMMFSMTQFFTNAAFNIFELFNWRYKVERTNDPDADRIADAIGSPRPKSINITDNPKVIAVTNSATKTITISRKLMQRLSREQLLAVIAHEIGHLKYAKRGFAEIVAAALATVAFSLYFLNIVLLVSPFMGALAEWAFLLLLLIPIMRHGEIRADGVTKLVGLNNELAEALDIIGKENKRNDGTESHPATSSRISRLISPVPSMPGSPSIPHIGLLDRISNVNWEINFTNPNRYRSNGIFHHILDYARSNNLHELVILDVGCSTGQAARTLKADLRKSGIQARVIGVDPSGRVRKRAAKNIDEFHQVDILKTMRDDLPLVDVVICSFAAIFVTGERRYSIIHRCAEQLKDDGVLVTNAFPFERIGIPTPAAALGYQVGALRFLRQGWRPFRSELSKRGAETAKRRTWAIRGRLSAVGYAERILSSWEGLAPEKKKAWKRNIIMTGWDFQVLRFLKYLVNRVRDYAD